MGSVPVVEASPGLDRALHDLPALVVRSLATRLTPHLLAHVAHTAWRYSLPGTPHTQPPRLSSAAAVGAPVWASEAIKAAAAGAGTAFDELPRRWPWSFERLTGAYWTSLVAAAAGGSDDVDGWEASGRQAGADDPTCHCWFPAGVCVDLLLCRDGVS